MKTIINIGTNKGNVTGVSFDKKFNEIKGSDVMKVVQESGLPKGAIIQGWCDVTKPKLISSAISSATFSPCRKYRYVLTRIWDISKPKIAFIGLNPSTANETDNDPTIRRVIGFAKEFGYGGVYMLNLFGLVTPIPRKLKESEDPVGNNDEYLMHYRNLVECAVFCWGNFNVFGRDKKVIKMFPNAFCLGKNSNGSPKHPLYLKSDTKLQSYETSILKLNP